MRLAGVTATDPKTVTDALAVFEASAELTAVTVCVPNCAGAVYSPALLMIPTVALPPAIESTDHVTAVLVVPLTVALNCCCASSEIVTAL